MVKVSSAAISFPSVNNINKPYPYIALLHLASLLTYYTAGPINIFATAILSRKQAAAVHILNELNICVYV